MDHDNSVLSFRFINFKYTQYQEAHGSLNFEAHFYLAPVTHDQGQTRIYGFYTCNKYELSYITLLTTSDHQGTE